MKYELEQFGAGIVLCITGHMSVPGSGMPSSYCFFDVGTTWSICRGSTGRRKRTNTKAM
jgi:hypothetical protein